MIKIYDNIAVQNWIFQQVSLMKNKPFRAHRGSYSVGYMVDNKMVAGFSFIAQRVKSIEVHLAITGITPKSFFADGISYARSIGVKYILCYVDSSNTKCRRLCERMGAKLQSTLVDCGYNGDLLIYIFEIKE